MSTEKLIDHIQRLNGVLRAPATCTGCKKTIPKGRHAAFLVKWVDQIRNNRDGQILQNAEHAVKQCVVSVDGIEHIQEPLVRMKIEARDLYINAESEDEMKQDDWELCTLPSLQVYHLHNCGVRTPHAQRRAPGSFESGKHR